MSQSIELLTKGDLLQFKTELIGEFKKLLTENTKAAEMEYLKSKEVKRILKCADSTLQYYRQSGRLPYRKVGGTYYYTKEGIDRLMDLSTDQ